MFQNFQNFKNFQIFNFLNFKISKKSNISKISKISKSILKSAVLPASLMPLLLFSYLICQLLNFLFQLLVFNFHFGKLLVYLLFWYSSFSFDIFTFSFCWDITCSRSLVYFLFHFVRLFWNQILIWNRQNKLLIICNTNLATLSKGWIKMPRSDPPRYKWWWLKIHITSKLCWLKHY